MSEQSTMMSSETRVMLQSLCDLLKQDYDNSLSDLALSSRVALAITALEAERDALREALQGLVADYDWSAGGKNIYAKEHPVTIARAALGAAQKAHEPASL